MSAIPRPRSRLSICDRFITGLPIAGMISMIIPDAVCLTDDGSNMGFIGIGYAIGCVSIFVAAAYRCIRHSRGVFNGIRLVGRRVIRPRVDTVLNTSQNALVTGAADRSMRLAARIMPRSAGARWYAEAESFLFEVPRSQRRQVIRNYLITAPRVITRSWASELTQRASLICNGRVTARRGDTEGNEHG